MKIEDLKKLLENNGEILYELSRNESLEPLSGYLGDYFCCINNDERKKAWDNIIKYLDQNEELTTLNILLIGYNAGYFMAQERYY